MCGIWITSYYHKAHRGHVLLRSCDPETSPASKVTLQVLKIFVDLISRWPLPTSPFKTFRWQLIPGDMNPYSRLKASSGSPVYVEQGLPFKNSASEVWTSLKETEREAKQCCIIEPVWGIHVSLSVSEGSVSTLFTEKFSCISRRWNGIENEMKCHPQWNEMSGKRKRRSARMIELTATGIQPFSIS